MLKGQGRCADLHKWEWTRDKTSNAALAACKHKSVLYKNPPERNTSTYARYLESAQAGGAKGSTTSDAILEVTTMEWLAHLTFVSLFQQQSGV